MIRRAVAAADEVEVEVKVDMSRVLDLISDL